MTDVINDREEIDSIEPQDDRERRRRPPIRWGTALASLLMVILVLTSLTIAASTYPAFCGLCHGDQTESFEERAHYDIPCSGCHAVPGALGLVSHKMEVLRMIGAALVLTPVDHAVVPSSVCTACHRGVLEAPIDGKRFRMSHREPSVAGVACIRCHGDTGHVSTRASTTLSMDLCMTCHADTRPPCDRCHLQDPGTLVEADGPPTPLRVAHGPNREQTHGAGGMKSCAVCHPEEVCRECHGAMIPHPTASWMNLHGKEARAAPASCRSCHDEDVCVECHGLTLPHPREFTVAHGAVSEDKGTELCDRCHMPTYCDRCHLASTHFFSAYRLQSTPDGGYVLGPTSGVR